MRSLLLMKENLHCIKPCKSSDKLPINFLPSTVSYSPPSGRQWPTLISQPGNWGDNIQRSHQCVRKIQRHLDGKGVKRRVTEFKSLVLIFFLWQEKWGFLCAPIWVLGQENVPRTLFSMFFTSRWVVGWNRPRLGKKHWRSWWKLGPRPKPIGDGIFITFTYHTLVHVSHLCGYISHTWRVYHHVCDFFPEQRTKSSKGVVCIP